MQPVPQVGRGLHPRVPPDWQDHPGQLLRHAAVECPPIDALLPAVFLLQHVAEPCGLAGHQGLQPLRLPARGRENQQPLDAGHVVHVGQRLVAGGHLTVGLGAMPMPLAEDEDGGLDFDMDLHHLERGRVPVVPQVREQPFVAHGLPHVVRPGRALSRVGHGIGEAARLQPALLTADDAVAPAQEALLGAHPCGLDDGLVAALDGDELEVAVLVAQNLAVAVTVLFHGSLVSRFRG